jgi:hypothetical protein
VSNESTRDKVSELLRTRIEATLQDRETEMAQHSSVVVRAMHDPDADRLKTEEWDEKKISDFSQRLSGLTKSAS